MRTLAILPLKDLETAKQRLGAALGAGSRRALALAMFSDVLAALRRVEAIESVAVVTSDGTAQAAVRGARTTIILDDAQDGQSAAAAAGIRHAVSADYDRVLLVPGDTPLIDPAEVTDLLLDATRGVTVVPDRHGTGTNALVLVPPEALGPAFGPGSFERHLELAREAGVEYAVEEVPSLLLDVDTPEDLAELTAALEEQRGRAALTRGALRQLDRSRPGPPAPEVPLAARL